MICSVQTLGLSGIRGSAVTAECFISNGLPGFDIVGLPDAAVKEARERVRAASKSSGFTFPNSRITVNLAPASLKKAGTHYDLPILLSILCAAGTIRRPKSSSAFLGEVSLDGQLRAVSGVLPMALAAKRAGIRTLFVPAENAPEATLAQGPAIIPVHTVKELAAETGCQVYLHELELTMPPMITAGKLHYTHTYGEGDRLNLAGLTIEVLHTPGHTPGSVCLKVEDALFSGDTLFAMSCGRTDLPGGSWKTIQDSLKRLSALKEDLRVYPGHGESTTLAMEKRYNPYMQ